MASHSPTVTAEPAGGIRPAVVFPTCVGDLITPDIPERTVAILRRLGIDAAGVCNGTCCGQPAFSAGHHGPARRVARATLRALDRTEGDIVVVAGSCAAMIRRHWRELFHNDRDEGAARRVAGRIVETSQILASRATAIASLGLVWNARIGYHDSCHMLRELRIRDEPRLVLGAIGGLDVVDLRHGDRCCGFGGTFSVRYPGVSTAMADTKLDEIADLGLDALVSCDGGCLLQLAGRADVRGRPVRSMHLVDVLYESWARMTLGTAGRSFEDLSEEQLAKPFLRTAIPNATDHTVDAMHGLFEGHDREALRDRGAAIRNEVLADLDGSVDRFAEAWRERRDGPSSDGRQLGEGHRPRHRPRGRGPHGGEVQVDADGGDRAQSVAGGRRRPRSWRPTSASTSCRSMATGRAISSPRDPPEPRTGTTVAEPCRRTRAPPSRRS